MKKLLCMPLAALMSGIVLHQALEDWIAGRDTVLEAIRKGNLPKSSN